MGGDAGKMIKDELKQAGVIRSANKPDYALKVTGDLRRAGEKLSACGWKQTGKKSFRKGHMRVKFVRLRGLSISKARGRRRPGNNVHAINMYIDAGAYSPLSDYEKMLPAVSVIKRMPRAQFESACRRAMSLLRQGGGGWTVFRI